jgi:hypothetical protein
VIQCNYQRTINDTSEVHLSETPCPDCYRNSCCFGFYCLHRFAFILIDIFLKIYNNKRLLHDIFHIGPGINPRLTYQARQRSWGADMGRGLISGTIWKISCHNLFITYFTLTFFQALTLILQKRQNAKINPKESCLCSTCKYFCFESGFKKISNNVDLYNAMTLESVCKIYPRR